MFAVQNPQYISFQPLVKIEQEDEYDAGVDCEAADAYGGLQWELRFGVIPGVFLDWSELAAQSSGMIYILHEAASVGHLQVACDSERTPLQEFIGHLIPVDKEQKADDEGDLPAPKKIKYSEKYAFSAEQLQQFPWLANPEGSGRADRTSQADSVGDDEADVLAPSAPGLTLDDDQLETLFVRLEAKRASWEEASGKEAAMAAFKVRILKGKWTLEHTGELADYCLGEHKGKDAKRFCQRYQLQDNMRFSMHLYGDREAYCMAAAWCSKMSHLYEVYLAQANEDYIFADADIASWDTPADYVEYCAAMNPKQLSGARKIDKIRPVRV